MNAEEFREKLSDYVDGELSPSEEARMDAKVNDSPTCARFYQEMSALRDRLRTLPKEEPSAEFEFALRSQILLEASKESGPASRIRQVLFPSPFRAAITTAAAAVVALGAATLLSNVQPADVADIAAPRQAGATPDAASAPQRPAYVAEDESPLAAPIDRGALTTLSEEESIALSGRLYRNGADSNVTSPDRTEHRSRPVTPVGSRSAAKRVLVSF